MIGEIKKMIGFYVLIILQLITFTNGAGILEVRLMSYANEGWRDDQGFCCGDNTGSASTSTCNVPCTPYFRICLKQWQNPIQSEAPCYFGSRVSEVFVDNILSTDKNLKLDLAHLPNYQDMMKFPFSFNWPGTLTLIVEAWHGTTNGSQTAAVTSNVDAPSSAGKQLLIRIAELRQLQIGYEWTSETHTNNHSRLEVQYRVVCEQHYYGDDCTRFCRPRDDQYGHHLCTTNGTKFCMAGWTGSMCNRAVCAPGCHPEHGTCSVPGECKCSLGYQGQLCEQCVRYPGCVHGTCSKSFECQCDEGWGGLFCNQDLNFCTHHKPCTNGATCTNTGSGHYTCQCRPGFTGVNCENRIETCDQNPCLNGATCLESTSNYTCQCVSGYSGRHCQSNARTCDDRPCENGASCMDVPDDGGYRCLCTPGYDGVNCDIEKDECADRNPCVNGGTCISRRVSAYPTSSSISSSPNNFYECSCPTGFTGSRCETNINDCSLDPCLNGGTCQDLIGTFKCECAPGFMGILCQNNVDDCLKRPCANGGTCFDLINDFRCMCRPGFRGKDCSIDINECESNPCRNGGTCTDSIDAYQCRCPPCFAGVNCEQRNDDCTTNNIDQWPRPDLFIPYNVSGVPMPSLFHSSSGTASGHTETTTNTNSSQSVWAIGVPILVVFALIMIALIIVVTFLYRKTKRQASTTTSNTTDLEACKRQNEWNEKRARQLCNNNNYTQNFVAKTDNRSINKTNDEGAKDFTKTKRLDPCNSPKIRDQDYKSTNSDQEKNLNSVQPNYYKIVSIDKLDFTTSHDERHHTKLERPTSFVEDGAIAQCSDSGLCTPISCRDDEEIMDPQEKDETRNRRHMVYESSSFDSGLAIGSPVSEREVVIVADDCHQPMSVGDVQMSNFRPSFIGQHQQQRLKQQQMHRHHHHQRFGQNHQRQQDNRSSSSTSINDNNNSLHLFTGETMLVMEERTPGAPVSHV